MQGLTPEAVDAYRTPQLVRGWEAGMLSFVLARLSPGWRLPWLRRAAAADSGNEAALASAQQAVDSTQLAERLGALVEERRLPVCIIHGAGDRLLPASNSLRLARMLPGCHLAVLKRAGHCPQEETPAAFAALVAAFLQKAGVH